MTDTTTAVQRDKLVADLKAVIADAEELLRLSVNQTGDEAVKMRERLQDRLLKTKERLIDVQHAAFDKAREAGRAADDYVHHHPWTSIGIGAGVGVLVGLLIGRR
jgi:ElaB/YqjD/DUF883 family membrane-anchored ribosome-binding protein